MFTCDGRMMLLQRILILAWLLELMCSGGLCGKYFVCVYVWVRVCVCCHESPSFLRWSFRSLNWFTYLLYCKSEVCKRDVANVRQSLPLSVAMENVLMWFLPRCTECRTVPSRERCPSARASDCLSTKAWIVTKRKKKSVQIFIPYEKSFGLDFWEKMVGKGDPFYLKYWANRPPLDWNRRCRTDIRSSYRLSRKPSEKKLINTDRNSTTRFPIRYRWRSYVIPKA